MDLSAGTATGDPTLGNDQFSEIENVTAGGFDDILRGGAENNVLEGGAGNDTLEGGASDDELRGEDDDDLLQGGVGDDTLTGDSGDDQLLGQAGNDDLDGGNGDDTLEGGDGDDDIDGGSGNGDVASYANATGSVTVDIAGGTATGAGVGTDSLTAIEHAIGGDFADTLLGNGGANDLSGGNGADLISGGSNDDTLRGGDGDDTLTGGPGDDSLEGNTGVNIASYADATDPLTVDIAAQSVTGGGSVGSDSLSNINGAFGGSMDDMLVGDGGTNVLEGRDGNDTLQGAGDNDTLNGGADTDTALYTETAMSVVVDLASGTATGAEVGDDVLIDIEAIESGGETIS